MNTDRAQHWNSYYDKGQDFRLIATKPLSLILSQVNPLLPKTHLDIGCGTGQLTRELYHRGYSCIGIDLSSTAIDIAKSSTVYTDGLNYLCEDFENLDVSTLPITHFSLITCKLVYPFMKHKEAFLQKVHAMLEDGGTFVIITPINEGNDKNPIAVDYEETLAQLESVYGKVTSNRGPDLTYFICSK